MKRTWVLLALALLAAACLPLRPGATATAAATTSAPAPTLVPAPTETPLPTAAPSATAMAEGAPVVKTIGPRGGTLDGPGGAALIVPKGALAEPAELRIAVAVSAPPLPAESALQPIGPAYELGALEESDLLAPVELVLPLKRREGVDESLYTVLRWDGSTWSDIGGSVQNETIRVQLTGFSLFQPALGAVPRRPVQFLNGGPDDARVRVATYRPPPGRAPGALPGGGWNCRAPGPPLAVERRVCRWLPLGAYAFTIEFVRAGQTYHYILDWPDGVGESDPRDCSLAQTVTFRTDVPFPTPGPGGVTQILLSPAPGAAAGPTPTPTPTPSGPTVTPLPGSIQTAGDGLIVTVKPGHPGGLSADGESQTVLLVDVDPNATCWGGPGVLDGLYLMAETTLGEVTWPGHVSAAELPAELVLTAGTTRGQAVLTVQGWYCPPPEVIVLGVCTDPAYADRTCVARAVVRID